MAPKTYTWLSVWFVLSYGISLWDAAYILLRPHSLPGGKWRLPWAVYDVLEYVDKTYDINWFYERHLKSIELAAKATVTLPEIGLAILYLYLAHTKRSPLAPLAGFSAALATLIKCILWTLEEIYCGWCTVGHNSSFNIFTLVGSTYADIRCLLNSEHVAPWC
ncbi:hypothetical protein NLJ89_g11117 [Agrocybe chaxingu]|uniref:Uncharacterized protein n=1 Tax=Agrocybe chaxingu TaxID=84603 RepID=A0A9W8JPB9_9AGAR|nr:hypothetical protein NLJ89_g11117 [Agrocybe chaxingu]